MNEITNIGGAQTMSSREVAELCEKQHAHVLRDVRVMIDGLDDDPDLDHVRETKDARGYTAEFQLPKGLTITLVAGYNVKLRKAIIDRWQELEAQVRQPVMPALLSRMELIHLALAAETEAQEERERRIALESKVEADAPKVAFAEQVAVAPDALSISQAAKLLGTGRNRLTSRLRQLHWITRINEPYQDKIEAGLLDVKIGSWDHPDKGLQRSVTTLVTGKGLAKLQATLSGGCA